MLVDIEWRGRVLTEWLCPRHLAGMQRPARKLGGAIVAQALLDSALGSLTNHGHRAPLPDWGASCVACHDIRRTIAVHAEAFLHAWLAEPEFRTLAAAAGPFCLPHFSLLYRQAGRITRRHRTWIRAELLRQEEAALRPLLDKVEWFVRKFDARFQDAPWDGAEDAVEQAVGVLAGSVGAGSSK